MTKMKFIDSILGLRLCLLAIVLLLTACSGDNAHEQQNDVVKSDTRVALPAAIRGASLPTTGGVLRARILVNGSEEDTKIMNVTDTDVTFILTLSPGNYTFTVVFEYDDPEFDAQTWWELARATTSEPVTVEAGSSIQVPLPVYTKADFDGDGVDNVTELDESVRTNPNSCVLDSASSRLGACQLG
jgi:hypothetical protein